MQKLFQPLAIGPRQAKNRIIFGSHTTNFAEHNLLSARHADYYAARAAGGAGIIVLEEHIVHPSDLPYAYAILGYLPATPTATARVVERIHAHSSLALVQLNHTGSSPPATTGSRNYGHHLPSSRASHWSHVTQSRPIPTALNYRLQTAHCCASFSRRSPTSAATNTAGPTMNSGYLPPRQGAYNRLRFVQETLEAVNAAIGADHVLGVRLCADELAPWAGLTPEQSLEIARLLVATGRIDYLTITMGSILSTHMFPFHASIPPKACVKL